MQREIVKPHLLYIGGDDHALRIPFMLTLLEHGYRVTAAATADPAPFVQAGIDFRPFRCYRFMDPLGDWKAIGMFSELIADVQPDIVQTFNTKPNLLVPLAARRLPGVVIVRTINGLAWTYSSRSLLAFGIRRIYPVLHRLAARFTKATVFQNRDDKAFFERHGMTGNSLSRLIPGSGIDAELFKRAQATGPSPSELRDQLGLGSSKVVVTVTRMTRQKGIPALLKAAAIVHETLPDVRFLLVGPRLSEGPLAVTKAEIEAHAPYVISLGQRSDVPSLLGLADLFAFPTEYREGVPRVLLEASLARLPIVATQMPGCVDVVRDGWNGVLVPPGAPDIMARKIIDLLGDHETATAMGERAAEYVTREFDLRLTVNRYAALYSELLDTRHLKDDSAPGDAKSGNHVQKAYGVDALGSGAPERATADSS